MYPSTVKRVTRNLYRVRMMREGTTKIKNINVFSDR